MPLDVPALRSAVAKILAALEAGHERLTAMDGVVGDGDLGITLLKAFRELDRLKDGLPDADLGQALMQAAAAVAKVSSSSFGTLLATSLMTVARQAKGEASAPWAAVPGFLDKANEAMMARGKAALGDKTVLDAIAGASRAMGGLSEPGAMLAAARAGAEAALAEFREKPSRIGRARIFAERTVGLDDPGMAAFKVMLEAL